MFLFDSVHRLGCGCKTSGRRRASARSFLPLLEALETYQLLSTFTVVLATDGGGSTGQEVTATTGDLRYCVEQADAVHSATTDTINFSATLFGQPQTIILNSRTGPLVLNDSNPLTINGPAGDTVMVSGGDAVEVLDIAGGTVSISDLAISHGKGSDGGGIKNLGTLTLTNCTLDHDQSSNGGGLFNSGGTVTIVGSTFDDDSADTYGGGIYNVGTLTVSGSDLSDNSATRVGGAGIFIDNFSTVALTNCALSNDSSGDDAGGVFVHSFCTVTMTNCTLSNDSAVQGGGGVCIDSISSTVTMNHCTISNDSALVGGGICISVGSATLTNCTLSNDTGGGNGGGGGLINAGTATVTACTFSNDSGGGYGAGGGLLNQGAATVTACTFSHDSAPLGGVMDNAGTATLTNCTFSNDSAFTSAGGGIWNAGGASITVTNCTLANNSALKGSGGGIWNGANGTLILTNTIVAQNTAAVPGRDVENSGKVTTDHDLIGKGAGSGISKRGGNIVGGKGNLAIDPRLGPLKNNGGPTQTLALLRDSPAIGHADDAAAPPTDQRGHPRTNHLGGHTDIGAYEYP